MLQIYNTLTQKKEIFTPINPGKIKFYVCGITVYDYCHLGHARTFVAFDVIVRYLKFIGYDVTYVRNITDIDDKIIKRANENNEDYTTLTTRFIQAMHEDFEKLNLLQPEYEPRATEYIPHMTRLIQKIIERNQAYVGQNGDVYFDVRRFTNYGCLSHHDIEQLESGARVDVSEVKNDPLDFALWKLAKENEPSWDSPWGKGRPGWHIECSAMSMDLLGEHFDFHGGGRDLIFPHHENELAQSRAGCDTSFVNYWMHSGYLQIDKEKMSKSLGNFITIRDILRDHDAETCRYLFLSSHYRSPLLYSDEALHQAKQALTRLYTALRFLPDATCALDTTYETQFKNAMNDDFNTPIALSVLFDIVREINRTKTTDLESAASHAALLKKLGNALGLLTQNEEHYFQETEQDVAIIEKLIQDRMHARATKNWQEADRIRQELAKLSVVIEDGKEGTTWRKE